MSIIFISTYGGSYFSQQEIISKNWVLLEPKPQIQRRQNFSVIASVNSEG